MSTSSCTPREPFIKLEDTGEASILNYNLPQSTCYRASSYLELGFDDKIFIKPTPPKDNFWELTEQLSKDEWMVRLNDEIEGATVGDTPIFENSEILLKDDVSIKSRIIYPETSEPLGTSADAVVKNIALAPKQTIAEIANIPITQIADKITRGFRPMLIQGLTGKPYIRYIPRPKVFKPTFAIELKLKMCSYLGDYGAGRTVKTFSLLPGEQTTISIKTWERNEESKKEASNVLDSLSESSSNELQSIIESEVTHSRGTSSTNTNQLSAGGGLNVGLNLGKFLNIGVNANASSSQSRSFTSAIQDTVRNLVNSTSTQASKSDSLRQIEINTETNTSSSTGYEESIVRELENINKSRVLNFVFRQLMQEFYTITYLDDVSFVYSDGYAGSRKVSNLAGLMDFLKEIIDGEDNINMVLGSILNRLCGIVDYEGNKIPFIECVEEELECNLNCSCLPDIELEKYCYFRKIQGLSQTYNGKTVDGIILDVTHRILRTPALVVDALLGQGEALDCYNQKLQDAAVQNAVLNNNALEQAIATIEAISDPTEKATLYKKVFGDCCDVPQSGCGCNNSGNA